MRRLHPSPLASHRSPSAPRFLSKAYTLSRDCSRQAIDSLNGPQSANQHLGKDAGEEMCEWRTEGLKHYALRTWVSCRVFIISTPIHSDPYLSSPICSKTFGRIDESIPIFQKFGGHRLIVSKLLRLLIASQTPPASLRCLSDADS